ncbi:phage portal protein [Pedobacter sp. BS3]|uniref:VOC family protein n=1 Tax=Pedobacter sp. BS3 TaxID=2567937 RepID=UPI0011EC81A0|nr:VOC family protein [Pedobacter sp. BS3]TZF83803.1 phage portal protein [Pedobacter sp. BS3]
MINFRRADHVLITIPVGKREEARRFYTQKLVLTEIPGEHPNNALWFQIGDIELHLIEEGTENDRSARHPAFEVDDLEKAKAHLQNQGIEISFSSKIKGRDRCFFRDPFGNRFELLCFE